MALKDHDLREWIFEEVDLSRYISATCPKHFTCVILKRTSTWLLKVRLIFDLDFMYSSVDSISSDCARRRPSHLVDAMHFRSVNHG